MRRGYRSKAHIWTRIGRSVTDANSPAQIRAIAVRFGSALAIRGSASIIVILQPYSPLVIKVWVVVRVVCLLVRS